MLTKILSIGSYSPEVQCIFTYPNLAYPNPRISEQPKQDYNIIHIHFNDIHIAIELSVIYFSMYFTYQLYEQKYFLLAQRGSDK